MQLTLQRKPTVWIGYSFRDLKTEPKFLPSRAHSGEHLEWDQGSPNSLRGCISEAEGIHYFSVHVSYLV